MSFNGAIPTPPDGMNVNLFGMVGNNLASAGYSSSTQQTHATVAGNNPPQLLNYTNLFDFNAATRFRDWLNRNSLNMSQAVTFDVIDMRRIFQYQKYLERNMRAGARYTEQLKGRFGVRPQDSRLQRPEYIGGTKSPIIVSEVLQTSETTSGSKVLGQMGGHAITAEASRVGKYNVMEHGYIIGLCVVMPSSLYMTGVPRECLRRTRYDYPTPELVNLSEVAIYNAEVCVAGNSRDGEIFGYQGIYDEMRISESKVVGDMRDTLKFWHLGRDDFDYANPPSLNENFVTCNVTKRIFAVENVKGLVVHYGNRVRAVRPLPITAEPGLIDHH